MFERAYTDAREQERTYWNDSAPPCATAGAVYAALEGIYASHRTAHIVSINRPVVSSHSCILVLLFNTYDIDSHWFDP